MYIKREYSRTNFIDENDVFLGWDDSRKCCEEFKDWISSDKEGDDLLNVPDTFEGYVFDTNYYNELDDVAYSGGHVVFRLTKDGEQDLYLHLRNSHNGYYSHGFAVTVGGEVWKAGRL